MSGFSGFSEVADGIWHWSEQHERIGQVVHSYLVEPVSMALDPIWTEGLEEGLRERGGIATIALTNRHHLRGSARLRESFDCEVRAPEPGMHEFGPEDDVTPYRWGEEIAPGVRALEVGAICPDDGALLIEHGTGALALADSVIGWDGELSFVPDFLMDDPERVKSLTLERFGRLLEHDFDALLLAHGEPIRSGAKRALESFIADPAQATFGV